MARRSLPLLLLAIGLGGLLGGLAGCSKFERAERPAWRTRAENACFAQRRVALSPFSSPRPMKSTARRSAA